MMRKQFFLAVILSLPLGVFASNSFKIVPLDSLLNKLSSAKNIYDTIEIYFKLSEHFVNTDIRKAEFYGNQTLQLSEQIAYKKGIADGYYALARLYHNSHYDISFNFVQKALPIYREIHDDFQVAKSLNLISIIKSNLGDFKSALEYSNTILDMSLAMGDSTLYAMVLNNIGTYYDAQKNDSAALLYYQKAIKVNQIIGHKRFLSINYGNISISYREKGDLTTARNYMDKSKKLKNEINDLEGFGWICNEYGKILEMEGKNDSALFYYHKSIKINQKFNNLNQQENTMVTLQKYYDKKGLVDSAYYWLKALNAVRDSIYDNEKTKNIYLHEISQKYKQQKELNHLKYRAQIFKLAFVILALCIIILITVIVIYSINNRRKKIQQERQFAIEEKEKLEKELVVKNQELATYVMNLVNKNQLVNNVISKLESQMDKFTPENRKYVRAIASELSASLNKEIWKEFEVRFNQVHPDFQNKILKDYPTLTPNELKLCAFLRMNMASKEISQITYQSVQSIEKARSRLRKKLQLTNTDTSLVYFLSKY